MSRRIIGMEVYTPDVVIEVESFVDAELEDLRSV
jgi:hypothetical protein